MSINDKKSNVTLRENKDIKKLLIWGLLIVIDIILIVYFAGSNYANYATVEGKVVFVGDTKNLLFGRNYIGLIVSLFMFGYGILMNKFFKNKFRLKSVLISAMGLLLFNMLLFYLFTNKIY